MNAENETREPVYGYKYGATTKWCKFEGCENSLQLDNYDGFCNDCMMKAHPQPVIGKGKVCSLALDQHEPGVNCGFHQVRAQDCDWRDAPKEREERARDKAKP